MTFRETKDDRVLVVGIFQSEKTGRAVLKNLYRSGFRRVAAIHASAKGRCRIEENGISAIGGAAAAVVLSLGLGAFIFWQRAMPADYRPSDWPRLVDGAIHLPAPGSITLKAKQQLPDRDESSALNVVAVTGMARLTDEFRAFCAHELLTAENVDAIVYRTFACETTALSLQSGAANEVHARIAPLASDEFQPFYFVTFNRPERERRRVARARRSKTATKTPQDVIEIPVQSLEPRKIFIEPPLPYRYEFDGRFESGEPGLDNHAMGTVFEELVRKFNEENNEEAGEHWTPRDAVKLMANLIFRPIADRIESGAYLLYDGALGTGGMLTVAEDTLRVLAAERRKQVTTHLYGQEINPETYAICKADMILKGEGETADHIVGGAEWSTLSHDAFPAMEFDFMLSNPPYGKSWKKDLENMGGKDRIVDPRFRVTHKGEILSLVTRSSDGQMLFLANLVSKMNQGSTLLGSRIAEVHNGSSLFTGDAGQGESNIRRWIIENDWLEAIVALPLNMFYNTGIATYIWVISNKKAELRRGKVQLIDATQWFKPLRKNLGKKNCELSADDIEQICETYSAFKETEQSKIFNNEQFGYWKVTVERPLRLHSQFIVKAVEALRFQSGDEEIRASLYEEIGEQLFEDFDSVRPKVEAILADWGAEEDSEGANGEDEPPKKGLPEKKKKKLLDRKTWEKDARLYIAGTNLREHFGDQLFEDYNVLVQEADSAFDQLERKLSAAEQKTVLRAVSWRVEGAPCVRSKIHRPGKVEADSLRGRYEIEIDGTTRIVEYEPDSELRDTEQVPLLEEGGIEAFIRREVLPYAKDAWIDDEATKIGYEISFTRYFYKPQPLRTLDEIRADIISLEKQTEGLLEEVIS
jgi:type I restriction enzyme M protein